MLFISIKQAARSYEISFMDDFFRILEKISFELICTRLYFEETITNFSIDNER